MKLTDFSCVFFLFQVTPRSETPINSVGNSLENALHTSAHSIEESLPKRPSGKHSKGAPTVLQNIVVVCVGLFKSNHTFLSALKCLTDAKWKLWLWCLLLNKEVIPAVC